VNCLRWLTPSQCWGKEKFGVTFSFRLKRLISALKTPLELYSEARNDIVEGFARRDSSGAKITTADGAVVEMQEGWMPKMRELNSLSAAKLDPISAKELITACEAIDCGVSGQLLADLGPLLLDDLDDTAVPAVSTPALNGSVEPQPEKVMG
jgi:hypothetical protein